MYPGRLTRTRDWWQRALSNICEYDGIDWHYLFLVSHRLLPVNFILPVRFIHIFQTCSHFRQVFELFNSSHSFSLSYIHTENTYFKNNLSRIIVNHFSISIFPNTLLISGRSLGTDMVLSTSPFHPGVDHVCTSSTYPCLTLSLSIYLCSTRRSLICINWHSSNITFARATGVTWYLMHILMQKDSAF